MICDRVGDGDKFLYESLGLGRPHFNTSNHLKIDAAEFFL